MKKTIRTIFIMLVSILMIINLFGCGDSKKDKSENITSKNDTKINDNKKPENKKPENSKIDLKGESIKLVTWWDDSPKIDDIKKRVADIEKKYNCKLEFLNIPYDQLVGKFTTSVLSGNPIGDYVRFESPKAVPVLVENDLLLPLDDYFDYSDPKYPKFLKDCSFYKGKYYGMHSEDNERGFFLFNKEIFKNAGYSDIYQIVNDGKWTWDKFLEVAKKTTKDLDGDGVIDQWGYGVQSYNLYLPFILSNGGNIVGSENDKYFYGINSPNAHEALKFISDLYKIHKVVLPLFDPYEWNTAKEEFGKEKVAMEYGWIWEIFDFRKGSNGEKFGILPVPKGPKMSEYVGPSEVSQINVMPKNAKHPMEVSKIVQELYYFEKDASEHTNTLNWYKSEFGTDDVAVAKEILKRGKFTYHKAFPGVTEITSNLIGESIIKKDMSIEDSAKEAEEKAKAAIADAFKK